MRSICCFFVTILLLFPDCYFGYTIPSPYVEILSPRGFRVSIPDERGITLFGFHGKINQRFRGNEEGNFHADALRARNGMWVYENTKTALQEGDVLYFWIYVQHERLGYLLDNQEFQYSLENIDETTSNYFTEAPTKRTTSRTTTRTTTRTTPRTTSVSTTPRTTSRTTSQPTSARISTSTDEEDDSFVCEPSITTVRGKTVCQNELIFEENFDSNLSKRWKYAVEMPLDTEDAEFVSYQNLPNICYVRDGNFNIYPKLLSDLPGFSADSIRTGTLDFADRCTGVIDTRAECSRKAEYSTILPPVVSCQIKTKGSFTFKYGKIEIRAKLPKGDWLFPQLHLEPADNSYGVSGFGSGLLRVAFIRGNDNLKTKSGEPINGRKLSAGAILVTREKHRDIWMKSTHGENHFGDDFHTYELTWTNKTIQMSLDGVKYGTLRGGFREEAMRNNVTVSSQLYGGEFMAPFDKEFYLVIGVGVGGISDFPDLSQNGYGNFIKPWSNTSPKAELKFWNDVENWNSTWDKNSIGLQVDYIKVWSI